MKRIVLSLLTIIVVISNVSAQECNCKESFKWMVSIFENNDAGFQYVIDKKGVDDYKKHTALFEDKAKNTTSIDSCRDILDQWLKYFRPGHLGVSIKVNDLKTNGQQKSDAEIRLQFKNEKTVDLSEQNLISILEKKKNKNPIEGIWTYDYYTIGIIADDKSDRKFAAFIIKADSIYWMPKQVKAEFTLNNDLQSYSVEFSMRDHTKKTIQGIFLNDSKTILNLNGIICFRKYSEISSKRDELYLSFLKSRSPFIEKLSDKTIYLRIPSFKADKRKDIDTILSRYNNLITSTPNLIIDIRNGTGGSDASYNKILPYLYTNPFRYLGGVIYATELNATEFDNYANFFDDTSKINGIYRLAAKMRNNIGKFISIWEKPYQIDTLKKVFPYPQNVAIICNQNNGSADEQFLLTAKQSRKVKVFGRPTAGMLDISNLNEIDFPNSIFILAYGMSKSFRIPNYCIDGVGIQPDYFIDDAIPEYDWIEYTKTKLEELIY